mmetsp:Transcript_86660/g.279901  ORF Transcript_86660/g.279901 Transcript_86660/m.279901 type:complete len:286 (+) Transcript_86660:1142-1999(+)
MQRSNRRRSPADPVPATHDPPWQHTLGLPDQLAVLVHAEHTVVVYSGAEVYPKWWPPANHKESIDCQLGTHAAELHRPNQGAVLGAHADGDAVAGSGRVQLNEGRRRTRRRLRGERDGPADRQPGASDQALGQLQTARVAVEGDRGDAEGRALHEGDAGAPLGGDPRQRGADAGELPVEGPESPADIRGLSRLHVVHRWCARGDWRQAQHCLNLRADGCSYGAGVSSRDRQCLQGQPRRRRDRRVHLHRATRGPESDVLWRQAAGHRVDEAIDDTVLELSMQRRV